MSRFNTGNPLGSNDPRDLDDNAKNMDLAVNSEEAQWIDRFGRPRLPLMEQERQFVAAQERHEDEFQSAQDSREDRFNDFIASSGYQFAGDYGPGIEITEYNQLIRDSNGEFWRVSGQVDLPYVTTGAGIPEDDALVPAGDAVLRQDLANPDKGAAMVARGVVAVDSIADLLALPEGQRKEGLRYLVKGYHAGSDVGGGEFLYDESRASDYDGGAVLYGFVRIFQNHIVTPEMFGAVGDGVVDDTQALAGVMAFARANLTAAPHYGSRHTVHGIGDYLISSNINITRVNIDMVGRFMLSDDFTDPEAISIGPAGNAWASLKIRFSVYGNRARQTLHPELIAVDMRDFNWRGADINITGHECFELLRVRGNCECLKIRVNASSCNHTIVEQDFAGQTPDENSYYIYGSSSNLFKQIPETPSSPKLGTSGYLYCACEDGSEEGDDYSIELNTNKFFQVEGYIRASRNGGIRAAGTNASLLLSLKNFMVFGNVSTTKKALLVESCAAVEGSILVRNGTGVQIDTAWAGGVLNIVTNSIGFGPSVVLGSASPVYGTYNVHDLQHSGGDVVLDLINVRGDVHVGRLDYGGIRLGSPPMTLSVPHWTIINNVPIEFAVPPTTPYIDLSVRGGLTHSQLNNYLYPINGMTAYNRQSNRRVMYRDGWKVFAFEDTP